MSTPFLIVPEYTGIAIAYRNPMTAYIADSVLPRRPVAKREFEWMNYNVQDAYSIPDTSVGRTSKPNQVESRGTRQGDVTIDYALDEPVPNSDITEAPEGYDPRGRAVMNVTDLVMLDREQRTVNIVFGLNTYDSTLRTTLSGTSQWSDYTNSNPELAIKNAMDLMLVRPNIAVIGRQAWTVLSSHPRILNAMRGYSGSSINAAGDNAGSISTQALASYLGLQEIIVGDSFASTVKVGQAEAYSRLWGKHFSLLVRNPNADLLRGGVTFGLTAQLGQRIAGTIVDPDVGASGGVRVRVAESVKEVVMSNRAGYLFQNCVG